MDIVDRIIFSFLSCVLPQLCHERYACSFCQSVIYLYCCGFCVSSKVLVWSLSSSLGFLAREIDRVFDVYALWDRERVSGISAFQIDEVWRLVLRMGLGRQCTMCERRFLFFFVGGRRVQSIVRTWWKKQGWKETRMSACEENV